MIIIVSQKFSKKFYQFKLTSSKTNIFLKENVPQRDNSGMVHKEIKVFNRLSIIPFCEKHKQQ